jgi:hypothetical protein
MSDDLSGLEDEVFRAPPKQFTAARDALVASLKAAGRAADAKSAKAWRRPPVPVWLWNRLILDGEESARDIIEVSGILAGAIAGGEKTELGEHVADLRQAGAALVAAARRLAAEAGVGLSTAQERELTELVQALPWSDSAREAAARGRLHEPPPPVDPLEAMRLLAGAPPLPKTPEPEMASPEETALAEAQAALAEAESALEEAQAARAEAEEARQQAQAGVARAEKVLAEAEARAEKAAQAEKARQEDVAKAEARLAKLA